MNIYIYHIMSRPKGCFSVKAMQGHSIIHNTQNMVSEKTNKKKDIFSKIQETFCIIYKSIMR